MRGPSVRAQSIRVQSIQVRWHTYYGTGRHHHGGGRSGYHRWGMTAHWRWFAAVCASLRTELSPNSVLELSFVIIKFRSVPSPCSSSGTSMSRTWFGVPSIRRRGHEARLWRAGLYRQADYRVYLSFHPDLIPAGSDWLRVVRSGRYSSWTGSFSWSLRSCRPGCHHQTDRTMSTTRWSGSGTPKDTFSSFFIFFLLYIYLLLL